MKKHILKSAILAVSALAVANVAYAGATRDNNHEGVAQYVKLSEKYQKDTMVGKTMKHDKVHNIEPAAGSNAKQSHEDSSRYNN